MRYPPLKATVIFHQTAQIFNESDLDHELDLDLPPQMYRLTVRSTKPSISVAVADLLESQF